MNDESSGTRKTRSTAAYVVFVAAGTAGLGACMAFGAPTRALLGWITIAQACCVLAVWPHLFRTFNYALAPLALLFVSAPLYVTGIIWNGTGVMTWRKTPDMTWTARTPNRAAYEMRFDDLRVSAEFLARSDCVEQRFTAANLTDRPGSFRTSSCFSLQSHPMFYDCEQLRTYGMDAKGEFVPMRRLSRSGRCVRWITGSRANELGLIRG